MALPLRWARRLVFVSLLVVVATGCPRSPTVLGVVIDQSDVTLAVGEALRFTAAVEVLHGASTALTWVSSDTSVLSIDGNGQAVAVGVGEARVSATSVANVDRSDAVTVSVRQATLALDPPAALLLPGEERTFTALISGADALALRWRATGGSVSGEGSVITYTAPAEPGNHRITVASSADPDAMATAYVTVAADAEQQRGRR